MIDIRNIYKETFRAIKQDTKLLDLLGVEYKGVDNNTFLTNLRKQVIEGSSPEDMLNDYSTRVCYHETSGKAKTGLDETAYLAVDVHITKDRNMQTGLLSDISKRIVEILDSKERKKQGLQPLNVGFYGFIYNDRIFDEKSSTTGWEKYTLIFKYIYSI